MSNVLYYGTLGAFECINANNLGKPSFLQSNVLVYSIYLEPGNYMILVMSFLSIHDWKAWHYFGPSKWLLLFVVSVLYVNIPYLILFVRKTSQTNENKQANKQTNKQTNKHHCFFFMTPPPLVLNRGLFVGWQYIDVKKSLLSKYVYIMLTFIVIINR